VRILLRHPAFTPEDHRSPDDSLKLSNVPGPRESLREGERLATHTLDLETVPRVGVYADVLDQERHVLSPLAERRHLEDHVGEAVVEVVAEDSLLDDRLEIAMGGGNHSDVDPPRVRRPDWLDLPRLEKARQHHLRIEPQVAHLVEEDRPAVGDGQTPSLLVAAPMNAPARARRAR
jgi:hypothetical protein